MTEPVYDRHYLTCPYDDCPGEESHPPPRTPGPIRGALYAVKREGGWRLARWDGEAYNVTSSFQSGDRWLPEWVEQTVLVSR